MKRDAIITVGRADAVRKIFSGDRLGYIVTIEHRRHPEVPAPPEAKDKQTAVLEARSRLASDLSLRARSFDVITLSATPEKRRFEVILSGLESNES